MFENVVPKLKTITLIFISLTFISVIQIKYECLNIGLLFVFYYTQTYLN